MGFNNTKYLVNKVLVYLFILYFYTYLLGDEGYALVCHLANHRPKSGLPFSKPPPFWAVNSAPGITVHLPKRCCFAKHGPLTGGARGKRGGCGPTLPAHNLRWPLAPAAPGWSSGAQPTSYTPADPGRRGTLALPHLFRLNQTEILLPLQSTAHPQPITILATYLYQFCHAQSPAAFRFKP